MLPIYVSSFSSIFLSSILRIENIYFFKIIEENHNQLKAKGEVYNIYDYYSIEFNLN